MTGREKYRGKLHSQPYDLEENLFDKHKVDADYDDHDLARAQATDDPLTMLNVPQDVRRALTKGAELGTDGNDAEDRVSEVGGKPRPTPVTQQLIQDAGGYTTEVDPRLLWKTETRFYCRACGEPIGSPSKRIECEIPADPCTPEMLDKRGGCQNCREQRAIDLKEARGTGNPTQACRPQPGEKESRCAKDWRNTVKKWERAVVRAEKRGEEPPPEPQPAEPKWTEQDLRKFQDAQHIAEARAEYEKVRPRPSKRQRQGAWDQDMRGTGFTGRDDLRKPGWS